MPKDNVEIKDPIVRRKLESAKDRLKAEKAYDQFEAELADAFEARKLVPALTARLDALEKQLARPVKLDATLKTPAKPQGTVRAPTAVDIAFALGTAHLRKTWGKGEVAQTLEELFPGDAGRLQRKAAAQIAQTTSAGWAAELVESDTMGWVATLEPVSIFGKMAMGGQQLQMGRNRSLTAPMRSASDADALAAAFTAEGATLPVKSGRLGAITFMRVKAGVLSVFTNELADVSTPNIETVIRQMVVQDTAQMLDSVLLNPALNTIPTIRPASPWFAAPTRVSAGTDLDAVVSDVSWLIGSITTAKPRKPVLIVDNMRLQRLRMMRENGVFLFRDEVEAGTLFGIPLLVSANVPTDKIYIIDLDDFASWAPPPLLDTSGTATVALASDDGVMPTMADTNAVNDGGGSIHVSDAATTTPATKVASTFQINATAVRHVQEITWGMLRSNTAAYVSEVAW